MLQKRETGNKININPKPSGNKAHCIMAFTLAMTVSKNNFTQF